MKNAILIHGTGGTPKHFWFPFIQQDLENKGYSVWAPQVPNADRPELSISLPFFLESGDFNPETILIGHSSGCPTIISILEKIDMQVAKTILVAGFYQSIDDDGFSELMLQKEYDWERIKSNSEEIILINTDDDPWGCDDVQARPIMQKLDATLIVCSGQGHMGSESFEQPYEEFPLLAKLV